MKAIKLLGVAFIALAACQGAKEDSPIEVYNSTDQEKEREILQECYQYVSENDTVRMSFRPDGPMVSGELAYRYYQKDKSAGTIHGTLQDSLLVAEYRFFSEGDSSTRQVVFKRFEDGWKEGYGPIREQDGVVVYEHLDSLDFSQSVALVSIPCDE